MGEWEEQTTKNLHTTNKDQRVKAERTGSLTGERQEDKESLCCRMLGLAKRRLRPRKAQGMLGPR